MAMIIGTGGADAYDLINDGNYNFGLEDDRIVGLGGTDFIRTGVGNDFLDGGSGNDVLADGDGDDTVIAGAGDDTVFADAGDDVFYGGEGTDTLNITNIHIGLSGSETNYTGIKLDLASTAAQDLGEFGVDRFFGFEDVICAFGNDTILGTSGANRIATFVGNDIIIDPA